jgi:alkylation response protein AidB-like acyl-CoA dehydrogenase
MDEELELFRDNIRRFIEAEILPNIEQWERDEITPRELWNKMGEQGLLAVDIPEVYGGFGCDFSLAMVVLEEFCRANCFSIGGSLAIHSAIVAHYVLKNGTEEQKLHYLPAMVSGECVGAIAMTEPGAGSDLQGIKSTARRDGDAFVINGSKTFITNGQHCDMVVVAVRTDLDAAVSKGLSLFIIDGDNPGLKRGRNLEKIGQHSADTSELFLEDLRVPSAAILGELDRGFAVLMEGLPRERLVMGAGAVAAAEGVLDETIRYVSEREVFGRKVADFQNTRFKLAEVATDIRVHRAFIEECKTRLSQGELDSTSASMAKYSATEMQGRTVDACLQFFGGYGYMREYGISRAFVDARAQRIYGGTTEIMKELISRSLFS